MDSTQEKNRRLSLLSSETLEKEDRQFHFILKHAPWLKRAMIGTAGFLGLLLVIGGGYYLVHSFSSPADVPLIVADSAPHKVKPLETETSHIPHQDKTIYNQLNKNHAEEPTTIAETEPEPPQSKVPVFPQDFLSALTDEEKSGTNFEEEKSLPQPKTSDVPIAEAEGGKEVKNTESKPEETSSSKGGQEKSSSLSSLPQTELASKMSSREKEASGSSDNQASSEAGSSAPIHAFKEQANPTPEPVPNGTDVDSLTEKESTSLAFPDASLQEKTREKDSQEETLSQHPTHQEPEPEPLEHAHIPVIVPEMERLTPNTLNAAPLLGDEEKGGYVVQIASTSNEAKAPVEWERLREKAKDLLGERTPLIRRIDLGRERGIFYRVQVGPFPKTEAHEFCASLKKRGLHCFTLPY